jgi:nitroreductase
MPQPTKHVDRPLTALDVIFSRRSVRTYTSKRLDKATVSALLDAAVQAPTALHAEPWAFVVIQDVHVLKRISDLAKAQWSAKLSHPHDLHATAEAAESRFAQEMAHPEFSIFYDARTLIVICAKPMGPFVEADCWLAADSLMLAACAMGLGSCCIGSAAHALNTADIKNELGIPPDVVAVAPVIVGASRETAAPVSRKSPEILCWK